MDFVKDKSGRHLLHLSEVVGQVPDHAKEASVHDDAFENLASHEFADPVRREFPIDSRGHVYLSYGYIKSAGVQDKYIIAGVRAAADRFGMKEDLDALDAKFDALVKQASAPERRHAIYVDFGPGDPTSENVNIKSGGVKGFYPMNSEMQVEDSAIKLANDRISLPISLFAEGCRTICKEAKAIGVPDSRVPRIVREYGEPRVVDLDFVDHCAEMRKQATGDDLYLDIARTAHAEPERSADDFIDLWRQADDLNGVKYGSSTIDPWRVFYSGITVSEMDQELEKFAMIQGCPVPVSALATVKEASVRKHLPRAIADQVLSVVKSAADKSLGSSLTAMVEAFQPATQGTLLKLAMTAGAS